MSYNIRMIKNYAETTENKVKDLIRGKEYARENDKPKFDLAANLLQLRQNARKSQIEVAAELGVDQRNLTRWECAEVAPNLRYLIALAEFYGVTVDRLLTPAKKT